MGKVTSDWKSKSTFEMWWRHQLILQIQKKNCIIVVFNWHIFQHFVDVFFTFRKLMAIKIKPKIHKSYQLPTDKLHSCCLFHILLKIIQLIVVHSAIEARYLLQMCSRWDSFFHYVYVENSYYYRWYTCITVESMIM